MKGLLTERWKQYSQAQRVTLSEAAKGIQGPPVMTFSSRMPAYTYTSLCPDPELRKPLIKGKTGGGAHGSKEAVCSIR